MGNNRVSAKHSILYNRIRSFKLNHLKEMKMHIGRIKGISFSDGDKVSPILNCRIVLVASSKAGRVRRAKNGL